MEPFAPLAAAFPVEFTRLIHEAGMYMWEYAAADAAFRVDDEFWRDLGYDPAEVGDLTPERFAAFQHPDDRDAGFASFRALLAGQSDAYDHRARTLDPDGAPRWYHMRGRIAERDAAGRPVRVRGTLQDIQTLKDAEARLCEQEERAAVVIRAANIGTWEYDPDRGELTGNDLFFELADADARPGGGRSFAECFAPEDRDVFGRFVEDCRRAPRALHRCELRLNRPEDRAGWVQLRGRAVDGAGGAPPARLAGAMLDITYRKRIEETNARRDRLLTAVHEVARLLLGEAGHDFRAVVWYALDLLGRATKVDRVYIWQNHHDADGRLVSTQLEEWSLGAEPQQGNEYTIAVPFEEVGAAWEAVFRDNRCINALVREMSRAEQANLLPQGIVSILVAPIRYEGRFWGFIGFDDCHRERRFDASTENLLRAAGALIGAAVVRQQVMREREEALERARAATRDAEAAAHAKDDFLARVSEEIRGSMRDVFHAARQLSGQDFSEVQQEYLAVIHRRSRAMERLVDDLTDYSLIESGRMALTPHPFDLEQVVEDACDEYARAAQRKGVEFVLQSAAELPPRVVGDQRRIVQVLVNLVDNAVKFTERGEVVVQLVGQPLDDGRASLRLAVMDTGPGLPPDLRTRLDDIVYGPDCRPVRNPEGIGFGLALVKALARLMGGSLGVVDAEGGGATFWTHFPLPLAGDATPRPRFGGRALVVDPNANAAFGIAMALAKYGVHADTAIDLETAAAFADAGPPYHWLFIEAAFRGAPAEALLRSAPPPSGLADVRRVLTVPAAGSEDALDYVRAGFSAVLFKPVRTAQLREILGAAGPIGPNGGDDATVAFYPEAES